MKCKNCGKELNDEEDYCSSCGLKVEYTIEDTKKEENTHPDIMQTPVDDQKQANTLCIISMILYFGSGIISAIIAALADKIPHLSSLSGLVGFCPLAGFIICVVARARYPKSKFAKTLLIVYIVLFVLAVVAVILLAVLGFYLFKKYLSG